MSPGSAGVHLLEGDEQSSRKLPKMGCGGERTTEAGDRALGIRETGNFGRLEKAFLFFKSFVEGLPWQSSG